METRRTLLFARVISPVYLFSAESWTWNDWEKKIDRGFVKVADSFSEFHASLSDGTGDDDE